MSTIKGRFGKLFGIEEISKTPTKNVREGKKDSNFKKQVFRIPKTTPEKLEQIKEFTKVNREKYLGKTHQVKFLKLFDEMRYGRRY